MAWLVALGVIGLGMCALLRFALFLDRRAAEREAEAEEARFFEHRVVRWDRRQR